MTGHVLTANGPAMHPSLRLGLVVGVPVLSAIFVVVSWRFYRRWRRKPAPRAVNAPPAVEPKEMSPIIDPPEDIKEVTTVSISVRILLSLFNLYSSHQRMN